jgi:hypothetical protein
LISSVINPFNFGLTVPAEWLASTVKVGVAADPDRTAKAHRITAEGIFMSLSFINIYWPTLRVVTGRGNCLFHRAGHDVMAGRGAARAAAILHTDRHSVKFATFSGVRF